MRMNYFPLLLRTPRRQHNPVRGTRPVRAQHMRLSRFRRTRSQELRIVLAVVVLAAVGTVTATVVSAARNSQADAATQQAFVRIQDVQPNVVTPKRLAGASSTASFIQDCGTNGNKKFSPDNPVAQPGIKNGAEHVHDFVGNLSTSAD